MATKETYQNLIVKLSLSGIPPLIQEYILDNLGKFDDAQIAGINLILDNLSKEEAAYFQAADTVKILLNTLAEKIQSQQTAAASDILKELKLELKRSQLR